MKSKLELYCVTNKPVPHLENLPLNLGCVSTGDFPSSYIRCDNGKNIFHKEKYYSELTFHYWYWKNKLNLNNDNWIGFCQRRRLWIKYDSKKKEINKYNLKDHLLLQPEDRWDKYDSIICEKIFVNNVKKIKMIKRGWRSLMKNPKIMFDTKKQTVKFHFEMHHGSNFLKVALEQLESDDKKDFSDYLSERTFFNPHIMFITKAQILNKWFSKLFPWLERCEEILGLKTLDGKYDTQRLYAFLGERYLSFWFKKYTNFREHPWVVLDI
tara:strand:- start:229 stop:1032 length:804 start_codon:yes stop_codon:yes gene_type:complete